MEGNVYRIFKNKSNGLDYFNEKEGGKWDNISQNDLAIEISGRLLCAKEKFLLECIVLSSSMWLKFNWMDINFIGKENNIYSYFSQERMYTYIFSVLTINPSLLNCIIVFYNYIKISDMTYFMWNFFFFFNLILTCWLKRYSENGNHCFYIFIYNNSKTMNHILRI